MPASDTSACGPVPVPGRKGSPFKRHGALAGFAVHLAFIFFFMPFLSGCAPSAIQDNPIANQKVLIWPLPPEPARISYLRTIEKPQDIGAGRGFFQRLTALLLGADYAEIARPYGVTVDSAGRLIVADTALKRVHIFDVMKNEYSFFDRAGNARFQSPVGAAADSEDNIYITDSEAGKVFVFNKKGGFLSAFKAGIRPTGIAINKADRKIYVADTNLHNIKIYGLDGKLAATVGKWGDGPGEFNHPVDICLDRNGELYVADTMNYRIQIFDKDGKFLTKFGHHGDGTGDFGRPKGIAVDNEGNVYVADAIFDTIQIFNRSGNFLLNFGSLGREAGSFWIPAGIYIDSADKIYVADSFNKRVQIFEYLGG